MFLSRHRLLVAPVLMLCVLVAWWWRAEPELMSTIASSVIGTLGLLALAVVGLHAAHEAGHVLVGRAVGWEVWAVTLGRGPRRAGCRLGGVSVELRGWLVTGRTFANVTGHRWRDVLALLGGVAAEAVIVVFVLAWPVESPTGEFLQRVIAGIALLDIVGNLWPHRIAGGPDGLPSDGAQVLGLLTGSHRWAGGRSPARLSRENAAVVQAVAFGDQRRAERLVRAMRHDVAIQPADAFIYGSVLLAGHHPIDALEWLAPVAEIDDAPALFLNNAAWAAVLTFDPARLPEADRWSRRAIEVAPDAPWCQSTRGATLARLGRGDEAIAMLARAAAAPLPDASAAYVQAFTALALRASGLPDASAAAMARAESFDPTCPVLRHLQATSASTGNC